MKSAWLAAGLLAVLPAMANSASKPPELRDLVAASQPSGCAAYRFAIWKLYDAELWTDAEPPPGSSFALSLTYGTRFTRSQLIASTISEMMRISGRPKTDFDATRRELFTVFADVEPGSRITAWRAGEEEVQIFLDGTQTGSVTQHVDLFFDIWLGPRTRRVKERQRLLGGDCDG